MPIPNLISPTLKASLPSDFPLASPPFFLLGLTHGSPLKTKLLRKQLTKLAPENSVVFVPEWKELSSGLDLKSSTYNADVQSSVGDLLSYLTARYPTAEFGVICDANLGDIGGPSMTPVVITTLAEHINIKALTLFTGTITCQDEATRWAKRPKLTTQSEAPIKYRLPEGHIVSDHKGILSMISLLVTKLVEEKEDETLRMSYESSSKKVYQLLKPSQQNPLTSLHFQGQRAAEDFSIRDTDTTPSPSCITTLSHQETAAQRQAAITELSIEEDSNLMRLSAP